ncbi:hypothetical protein ACQ4WX_07570 [Streptomyces lasalocidi]
MSAIAFHVTTAVLMVLMFRTGVLLIGEDTIRRRPVPYAAVAVTAVAVGAVVLQLCWSGAMDALDGDPRQSGWWRVVTSVFMQNGGVSGAVWNIITLAVIAALAQWFWGSPLMLALFAASASCFPSTSTRCSARPPAAPIPVISPGVRARRTSSRRRWRPGWR